MAGRKENLKSLFTNTRTRVIIIFTALLLIAAVVIGIFKLKAVGVENVPSTVANVPGIQSIPGALNPTVQYAKLQESQNVSQATSALNTGGSAIPTIIRTQALGEGVQPIGQPPGGKGGVGFTTLTRGGEAGPQQSLWIQTLKNSSCSKAAVAKVLSQGASFAELKAACTCAQLKDNGYQLVNLQQVCSCKELRAAGYNARQLKDVGFSAARLRLCGFDACELRSAGFTALQMKDGGYSDGELKGAGFSEIEIAKASGLPAGLSEADVRKADCQPDALKRLHDAGVTAAAIRRITGCSAAQLKAAGYTAADLRNAGFTAADLRNAGFSDADLSSAGFTPAEIKPAPVMVAGRPIDCSVASLQAARAAGISAATIKQVLGCSAAAMKAAGYTAKELKDAGFTAAELKNAGFSAADLKNAGFSAKELADAGFSPADLKNAGFSASELKDAGFSAGDLKNLGLSASQLKAAGFNAKDLKDAGFDAAALRQAGYSAKDLADAGYSAANLKNAGFSDAEIQNAGLTTQIPGLAAANIPGGAPSTVSPLPPPGRAAVTAHEANARQLQEVLNKQNQQLAEQKYQQKIQQRTSQMLSTANQALSVWQKVTTQTYVAGTEVKEKEIVSTKTTMTTITGPGGPYPEGGGPRPKGAIIRTGDIMFGVVDTSVNSDEPGPILATIVSGRLKGAKLIGSFNLPTNADKMVISFNTMSVPGAPKTTSISAYAIDPDTGRTALSSNTDHHYLLRYGSLFASSFIEGLGNAFQSANTTVSIGGTGGGQNITVQNGIHRSFLKNAVIALASVGKSWSQEAQQLFTTPTTVEVYAGTPVGILFTQDVTAL